MKPISLKAPNGTTDGLTVDAIKETLATSVSEIKNNLKRVLIIIPDFTRYHSNAGFIANYLYHQFKFNAQVDLLEALGTHVPMTEKQCIEMYGFIPHNWRTDTIKLGLVSGKFVSEVSEGLVNTLVVVEVNKKLFNGYDLIISIGQVVPHEVVGMANHSKNIFVGCGGADMINASHMLGAFYGMERMMGRDKTPVRKVFDYAAENFLSELPLYYIQTVTTAIIFLPTDCLLVRDGVVSKKPLFWHNKKTSRCWINPLLKPLCI
jgi:nickel-dependent lactate racemase